MVLIGPSVLSLGPWLAAAAMVALAPVTVAGRILRRRIGKRRNARSLCGRCHEHWSRTATPDRFSFDGVLICESCSTGLRRRLGWIVPLVWTGVIASIGLSVVGYLVADAGWQWYWNGMLVPGAVVILAPPILLAGGVILRLKSGKAANQSILAQVGLGPLGATSPKWVISRQESTDD